MGELSGTAPLLSMDEKTLIEGRSRGKFPRASRSKSPPLVIRSPLVNEGFDQTRVAQQVKAGVQEAIDRTYYGSYMQALNINMTYKRVDGEAINFKEVPLPKMAVRMLKLFKSHMIVMENLQVYPLIPDVGGANKDNVQMYRRAHEILDVVIYTLETTFDPEVYKKWMEEAQTYVDKGKYCDDDAPEFKLAPAIDEPAETREVEREPPPKMPRREEKRDAKGPPSSPSGFDSGFETEDATNPKSAFPTGMYAAQGNAPAAPGGAAAGAAGPARGPWAGQFQPGQELSEAEMTSTEAIQSQLKCIWSLAKKNPNDYIAFPVVKHLVGNVCGLSFTWLLIPQIVLAFKGGRKEVGDALRTVAPGGTGLKGAGKAMKYAQRGQELVARDAFGGKGPASMLDKPFYAMLSFIKSHGEALGFDTSGIPVFDAEWIKQNDLQRQLGKNTELSKIVQWQTENPFLNNLGGQLDESLSGWLTMSDESIEAWAKWIKYGINGFATVWRVGVAITQYMSWFHGIYTDERFKAFAEVNTEQFLSSWKHRLQTTAEKMKEYFKRMYTRPDEQAALYGPGNVAANDVGGIIGALNGLYQLQGGRVSGAIQLSYKVWSDSLGRNAPDTEKKTQLYNDFLKALRDFEAKLKEITDDAPLPFHANARYQQAAHTRNFALWRVRAEWAGAAAAQPPRMDFDFPPAQGVPMGPAQPAPGRGRGRGAVRGVPVQPQAVPGVDMRRGGRRRGRGQQACADPHDSVVDHVFFQRYGM